MRSAPASSSSGKAAGWPPSTDEKSNSLDRMMCVESSL